MTLTENQRDAIRYFMGWQEGDNITITGDFVEYAQELGRLLMKQYELTIIFDERLSEQEIGKIENRVILEYGSILNREDCGVKRLAYPIQGQDKGHYVFYRLGLDDTKRAKLSDALCETDGALRHLLVKSDTNFI